MAESKVAFILYGTHYYEAIKPAIEEMKNHLIDYDIYVPEVPSGIGEDTLAEFTNTTYDYLVKEGHNPLRKPHNNSYYKVVFSPYSQWSDNYLQFNIDSDYKVRFMYGLITKYSLTLKPEINFPFHLVMTYGSFDDSFLSAFCRTLQVGSIRFSRYKRSKIPKTGKKTVLYMPTYDEFSSSYLGTCRRRRHK